MSYVLKFTKVVLADIEKHKKAGDKAVLKRLLNFLMKSKKIQLKEPDELSCYRHFS